MNIALIGYGKMGKAIEKIGLEKGHQISFIIDEGNPEELSKINPENTDVAIEFTQPESAFQNISNLLNQGVKTISGTTGWLDHYDEIAKLCKTNNGTFLYASNYSLGVNLFFKLNKWLAEQMIPIGGFQVTMEEIHHTEKKDAPSGTAITLAQGILEKNRHLNGWISGRSDREDQLSIISLREPGVPGTHTIHYKSPLETIEIKHIAHDRSVFADGVIKVAEWVTNQSGLLTIEDFLKN